MTALPLVTSVTAMTAAGLEGWLFHNATDCYSFLTAGGKVAGHRSSRDSSSDSSDSSSDSSCCPCCPPVWDGFLCWPPAALDSVVEQPCPADRPQLNHASRHLSLVTCHLSLVTCHMSLVTCHLSPVTYPLSPVTCPLSPFTCPLSPVIGPLSPVPFHLSPLKNCFEIALYWLRYYGYF